MQVRKKSAINAHKLFVLFITFAAVL